VSEVNPIAAAISLVGTVVSNKMYSMLPTSLLLTKAVESWGWVTQLCLGLMEVALFSGGTFTISGTNSNWVFPYIDYSFWVPVMQTTATNNYDKRMQQ
jgi:hypothetical protein